MRLPEMRANPGGRDAAVTVGALDAASQLVTKHDVGELGLAVSTLSGVVANALEVVELDSTLRLYVGGP
jgi:hypothetical protein